MDGRASGEAAGEAAEGGTVLSEEEARLLLNELEAFVNEVDPGAGAGEEAEELRDTTERLVSSLEKLPLPEALYGEEIEDLATWTRLLVHEGGHERQGGPAESRALVHEQLASLRDALAGGLGAEAG